METGPWSDLSGAPRELSGYLLLMFMLLSVSFLFAIVYLTEKKGIVSSQNIKVLGSFCVLDLNVMDFYF